MTLKQIEQWTNKGLLSEDEANRLLEKVIEPQQDDDAWYYQKQLADEIEDQEFKCGEDRTMDDVDFSEIEV